MYHVELKKCEFWVHRSQNIHKGKGSLYTGGCQHNKLNSKQKGYKTKLSLQWCNKINSYETQRSHYSIPPPTTVNLWATRIYITYVHSRNIYFVYQTKSTCTLTCTFALQTKAWGQQAGKHYIRIPYPTI